MDIPAGLVLMVDASGRRFGALAFRGDQVLRELNGIADRPEGLKDLARLAEDAPVITDVPARAESLLAHAGVSSRQVWDVLELASLVVPASPHSLELAAEY